MTARVSHVVYGGGQFSNGLWRSLVALPLWVREVAGSNPASPTTRRDSLHHGDCGKCDALPGGVPTLGGDDGPRSRCGISVDSLPADIRGVVLPMKGLTSPPALVAQWIEQRPSKPLAEGSNPSKGTKNEDKKRKTARKEKRDPTSVGSLFVCEAGHKIRA